MTSANDTSTFTLAGRTVGKGHPALIIGEVAQAHDGSLGLAHAFIDAIARAGADAVKFQTHIAAAESTPAEPWRVRFSRQDKRRFDYWKRMEFSADQWQELQRHAEDLGLVFLSSPFSNQAVEMLDKQGVPAWKIASGEVNNPLLLERVAKTGKPVLISSGMSSMADLDVAVALFCERAIPYAVFQCTTAYPCPAEKVGLNLIPALRDRYQAPTGLSEHSGTIYPALAAAAMGVELIEVHVTLSREMFGPDVPASVTTDELRRLVEGVRFIERAIAHPCDKDASAHQLQEMRTTFGKTIVSRIDLPAGTRLAKSHLTAKKLGGGIPANQIGQLIGRELRRPVNADEPLSEELLRDQVTQCP
jgi:N-acetylneuraminate synthase